MRIFKELKLLQSQNQKTNIILSKCWNIILVMADTDSFIPKYLNEFEKELIPLFDALAFPEKIEFDDEILNLITTFIKKSKTVTPVMQKIFTVFPKYF